MNNLIKMTAIIALAALAGFTLAACGEDEEVITDGRLTITGLAAYEGRKIFARSTNRENSFSTLMLDAYGSATNNGLEAADNYGQRFPAKILSGQATLNVYQVESDGVGDIWVNYSGNAQNIKFAVVIVGTIYGTVTVNFTNGIASGVFVPDN